jgi:hypothetical protein
MRQDGYTQYEEMKVAHFQVNTYFGSWPSFGSRSISSRDTRKTPSRVPHDFPKWLAYSWPIRATEGEYSTT